MNASTGCMSLEDLRDFTQGTMPAYRIDAVEEHLATCDFCLHAVESSVGQDPWSSEMESALRDAPTIDGSDDPYECQNQSALLALLGPTDNPDMIGRIGIYEIVGILGRGGMGVVFKAFDAGLNRFVAIKMLLPQMAASPAARARFRREGQAAAAVVDEHVLPIHAVDEWRGVPYLVTRYVRGTTLQRRLDEHGPLRLQEILRIALQSAHGLAAAHAQGLVHRDIKPSNILLEGSVDRAILADFGLARAVDDASMTRSGVLAGTPQYMSPEQVRGEPIDQRSDLFSLGSAIYAMCTGRPPFRAETSYAVMRRITDDDPTPIREIDPELPDWLERLVAWLMEKAPDDRPESAEAVENLLRKCLVHVERPWATPLPPVLVRSSVRLPGPRFRRTAMLGIALAAIATFAWPGTGTTPDRIADPQAETIEATKQDKTIAISRSPEIRVEASKEAQPVPALVTVAQAPKVETREAVEEAPRRTEMKGETVAGGYRIRIAGTGSVEGLFPTTHFRQNPGLNAMKMQRSGSMESFRVEGGSFSSGGAFGQAENGGGASG
ncbi:protein kinase [bacterium]|nr:protein kinase [bacterium]